MLHIKMRGGRLVATLMNSHLRSANAHQSCDDVSSSMVWIVYKIG